MAALVIGIVTVLLVMAISWLYNLRRHAVGKALKLIKEVENSSAIPTDHYCRTHVDMRTLEVKTETNIEAFRRGVIEYALRTKNFVAAHSFHVYSKADKEVIKAMEAVVDRTARAATLIEELKLDQIKYNSQCPFPVVAGLCLALKRMGVKTDDSIMSLRYTADVLEHFVRTNSLEDLDSVFATFQVELRN